MKTYYLRSKKLTEIANNIFGNIVLDVYVTSYDKEDLPILVNYFKETKDSEILYYDGKDIIIEFINGNKVFFTNSEWASMSKCDDENFILCL